MTQPAKVLQTQRLNDDIFQLFLQPEDAFNYQAGDYLTLGFESPADDEQAKDFHHYKPLSIASLPQPNDPIELHIRAESQPKEDASWHQKVRQLKAGDTVWINGPFEQYRLKSPTSPEQPLVFIAGGTGFSPMKALLLQALTRYPDQPLYFYWGARQSQDLYLHDWMQALTQQHPNLHYIPVISEEGHDLAFRQGLVHQAVLADFADLSQPHLYLCGPWSMQQQAKDDFIQAGLPEAHFN